MILRPPRGSPRSTSGSGFGRSTSSRSCSATKPSACSSCTTGRRTDWTHDELDLCSTFAEPDGDGRRQRPAVRLGPRGRGAPAGDPGAVVAPQPDPGGRGDRRGDRRRGEPADRRTTRSASTAWITSRRPASPIAFQGEFWRIGRRLSTSCGCGVGRGADGLGGAATTRSIRLGDASADPRGMQRRRRRRRGVDAPGPDDPTSARPRRDRRLEGRAGPVRRDDDERTTRDLRRATRPRRWSTPRRSSEVQRQQAGARATGWRASGACWRSTSGCCRRSTRPASSS